MHAVDSTFIIDFLRGDTKAVEVFDLIEDNFAMSDVSRFEVMTGVYFSNRKKQEVDANALLRNFSIIPFTQETTNRAARIMADLMKRGKPVDHSDCLIAGAVLEFGIKKILTRNKKHFEHIPGIEVISY